ADLSTGHHRLLPARHRGEPWTPTRAGVRTSLHGPGMNHCRGGVGAANFGQSGVVPVLLDREHDAILGLQAWVEHGGAPDKMIGSHVDASGTVTFTRPLCPYPEEAVYTGHGDTNDAANFVCRVRHAGERFDGDDRDDRDR